MASEGRLEIVVPEPELVSSISAKKVRSRSSVMTTRSTATPRETSRSRMRSWVIGLGVSTPWRAKAMAVASTAPMKMGSTRCCPSASRRSTIGLLVGISTRTPTRCISTIG